MSRKEGISRGSMADSPELKSRLLDLDMETSTGTECRKGLPHAPERENAE